VKNKVAPPFKKCEFDMIFGKGIAREGEVLDLAVEYDIVHKSGAWFAYGGEKIGQGRDNAREFIKTHPEIMADIESKIKTYLENKKPAADDTIGAETDEVNDNVNSDSESDEFSPV
jgi:recombination protein RecA